MWWRELYGSDEDLDNNHLMRMAGRFSRRLRAWAEANGIPVEYCAPKVRKHEIAEEQLSAAKMKPGLFLILVSKAPALVWEAQRTPPGNSSGWCQNNLGPTSIIIPFISGTWNGGMSPSK